jgi:acetylornithine deacetylase/succinyl-diaminopimelate desuccinylase-like protein
LFIISAFLLFYPGDNYYTHIFAYNRELFSESNQLDDTFTAQDIPFVRDRNVQPFLTAQGVYVIDWATAKMNLRLVHNQKPDDIVKKFKAFVAENLPSYCSFTFEGDESCPAVHLNAEGPIFEKATKLMEDVYKDSVLHKYCGATIPLAVLFEESLQIPQLYIPMANEDCNMHGADENFTIDLIKKGLAFAEAFLKPRA